MQFITTDQRIAVENFEVGIIYTVTFSNGDSFTGACIGIGPDFVTFQRTAPKLLFCLTMAAAEDVESIEQTGSGFTPTEEQLAAMNSGITAELVAQIRTNENNILSIPRTDMDKLPITFTANTGGNLKGYTIFGNVDKVGEQTVNRFDKSKANIRDSVYPDGSTGEVKSTGNVYTVTIPCEASTTYTISKNNTGRRRVAGYSTYPQVGDVGEFVTEAYTTIGTKQAVTFTTTADTHYLLFFFSAIELTTEALQAVIDSIQLELGSTMTDYEPYGYKIPITCGGVTTNIYIYSQLDRGDMLTYNETDIDIPTAEGSNTIDTTLTNKPVMWIKYE